MTASRTIGPAMLVALLSVCLLAPSAHAKGGPDLTVEDLQALTPAVAQNQPVEISATVRNAGKAKAPKSVVGLYTSANRRLDKRDKELKGAVKVKKLGKRKELEVTGDAKLPGAVKPGSYELLACADEKSKAKEKNERNNCAPATSRLGVTEAPQPVNVAPRLDESGAADSPVLASGGGSAGAFGADGTAYTLIVPDGALTHDVSIKMTPLTGVDGLPLGGGLVAGVQIGDDSLQFAKPAQLVIQRDGLAPGPSQVAFGYHGAGNDFFVTPFGERPPGYPPEAIVIPITHGGGWGVANASDAEVAAQRAKPPVRSEDRLAQWGAELGGAVRVARASTTRTLDVDGIRAEASRLYAQVIQPQMTAAETNDAILDQAAGDAFGWMRQLALLGLDAEFSAEWLQILDSLEKGLENAYQKAKERCFGGDFAQVSRLLGIERFRQLIGLSGDSSTIFEDIDKCLRFELRVISHIEVHERAGSDHVDMVSELVSTVPLQLTLDGPARLTGEAPFEYRFFSLDSVVHAGCLTGTSKSTGNLQNGQLAVISGLVIAGDPGAPPAPPAVSMLIDPGEPQEEVHNTASGCETSFSDTAWEQNWLGEWTTFFHRGESAGGDDSGPWLIEGFNPGTAPSVGTKTFTTTAGARTLNEVWEVVHTPDRS